MKFCTITPTRGDRPQLLAFCKRQLERMRTKPDHSYFIDYAPETSQPDLVERVKAGVALAKQDGYDWVFIVEDDDYYPSDYFDFIPRIDGTVKFVGSFMTRYYNLRNLTYDGGEFHPGRSSLFNTGFRISAIETFQWPESDRVFLDIDLWKFISRQRISDVFWHNPASVGIKHGTGKCGGNGHKQIMRNRDADMNHLFGIVDQEAFQFYSQFRKTL